MLTSIFLVCAGVAVFLLRIAMRLDTGPKKNLKIDLVLIAAALVLVFLGIFWGSPLCKIFFS